MKIYLIKQSVNHGYDTYDGSVVIAENEKEAQETSPSSYYKFHDGKWYFQYVDGTEQPKDSHSSWCMPHDVKVTYLGEAKEGSEKGAVCSSFNAG